MSRKHLKTMMKMIKSTFVVVLAAMAGGGGGTQLFANAAEDDHSSTEWKIEAYSSSCPGTLKQDVTVMDGDMSVLKNGTNGWTAMPANPRGPSGPDGTWLDAHQAMAVCFDAMGLKWMEGWMTSCT